jgi:hypothetical protein
MLLAMDTCLRKRALSVTVKEEVKFAAPPRVKEPTVDKLDWRKVWAPTRSWPATRALPPTARSEVVLIRPPT